MHVRDPIKRPMRIISTKHLNDYSDRNPETKIHLDSWRAEVEVATWRNPNEVKAQFKNASIVGNRRIVFNIKGNEHRLVVAMAFSIQTVYVKFIGTHAQYDMVDAKTVSLET